MRPLQIALASMCIGLAPACIEIEIFDNIAQQAYIKASNADAQDTFGRSLVLSADGSTLAVGAFREDGEVTGINQDQDSNDAPAAGAVYVFVHNGATWSQQAYIKASNTGSGDQFGISLALSADGSILAVGATGEDSLATGIDGDQGDSPDPGGLPEADAGAVYVFTRTAGIWTQQAYVKASNTASLDAFGSSVALSANGSTLAVGAARAMSSTGAVYLFTRESAAWNQEAYLSAPSTSSPSAFGSGVTLSADGSTLAVGAPCEGVSQSRQSFARVTAPCGFVGGDPGPGSPLISAGAAYVFTHATTTWTQQARLVASNADQEDNFGYPLALSADGSTLAVSAPFEASATTRIDGDPTDNSAAHAGAVYLFARSGMTWSQQAYIKPSNAESGDVFGNSVALSGDGSSLAVGAPAEASPAVGIGGIQGNDSAFEFSGAVYVFRRSGTTWRQRAYVKASNTGMDDHFGSDVALSRDGSIIAVGADGEGSAACRVDGDQNDNGAPNAGAAYVFLSQPP